MCNLLYISSARLSAKQCLRHPWLLPSSSPKSTFAACNTSKNESVKHTSEPENENEEEHADLSSEYKATREDISENVDSQKNIGVVSSGKEFNDDDKEFCSFNGKDDSSGVSSSSSSPVPPSQTDTKKSAILRETAITNVKKDCTARKESLDLTKEHLKEFVSNWTANPYLFDSSREIISHVCSASSSTSPSPPLSHHCDSSIRRHSHKINVETPNNSKGNSKNASISQINSKSNDRNPVQPQSNKSTNSTSKTNSNNSNNNTSSSKPVTFECGVNIVSQIRKFSYQFHEELELMKANGNSKANSSLRKYPVNVK